MRRAALSACVVLALLAAPAHGAGRCDAPKTRTLAQSSLVRVYMPATDFFDEPVTACLRATGRRRTVVLSGGLGYGPGVWTLRGTTVGYRTALCDKSDNWELNAGCISYVATFDARTGARMRLGPFYDVDDVLRIVLGDAGRLAFVGARREFRDRVVWKHAGRRVALLDANPNIAAGSLRIAGGRVHWTSARQPRSAPLEGDPVARAAAAADRCRPRGIERVAAEGAFAVVLEARRTTRGGDDLTIFRACRRSTGRRTVLGASSAPDAASFRFAGRFVALVEEDALALTIADARRGRRLARSASLAPDAADAPALVDLRLSATGHAAWLVDDGGLSRLYARAGRRLLEVDRSTAERGLGALSLRGATLRWTRGGTRRARRLPPVA